MLLNMAPNRVFEKTQFPRSQWIAFQKLSQVNTRTDQVGNKMVDTNWPEKPRTPWFHKAVWRKQSVHSLFLLQLQMRKNVKGFKSESLPNESKNLGCAVKLHTVEAFGRGGDKNKLMRRWEETEPKSLKTILVLLSLLSWPVLKVHLA